MKRPASIILNTLCTLTLLIGISSESFANWYSASNNGCLVWYRVPADDNPNEEFTVNDITWCGDCFYGFAQGAGVLTANCTADIDGENYTYDNSYKTFMSNGKMSGYTVADQYIEGLGRSIRKEVEYKNGTRNGLGVSITIKEETESHYQGEWKDGVRSGLGVWWIIGGETDGYRYEGEFKKDLADGLGVYTYDVNDGERYEGQFENGTLNGFGVYYNYCSDDERWIMEWVDGYINGLGSWYRGDNNKYEGNWGNDDYFLGIIDFNGSHYEGESTSGMTYNGYGVYQYPDGNIVKGKWNETSLIDTNEEAIAIAEQKANEAVIAAAEAQSLVPTIIEVANSATVIANEAKAKAEESLEVAALAREQATISQETCTQLTDALGSIFEIFVSNIPGNISLGIRAPQNAEEAHLYLELTQLPYEYGWNDQSPSLYYTMESNSFTFTKTPILSSPYPVNLYNFDTFFVFPLAIGEIELAKGFYKFKAYLTGENGEVLYGPSEVVFNNDCVDNTCNDVLKNCEFSQEFRETFSDCIINVD